MTETVEFIEFSEAVKTCDDIDMLWGVTKKKLNNFGVTSFLYGMLSSRADLIHNGFSTSGFIRHDYPQSFVDTIDLDNLLNVDYTIDVVLQDRCCIWSDESEWIGNASKEQIKLAQLETELGMGVGVSIPSSLFSGENSSGFGICTGELNEDQFNHMWSHKQDEFFQVLSIFDMAMRKDHCAELIDLTQREIDVLSFFAVGMRLNDIADLLNVSSKTLEKYVASAKGKLKAKTRDHAVAKAVYLNLIKP